MFNNYLKLAFRIIRKQKVFSFVNVFGLSVGIACCILIYLFVRDEWGWDRFHEHADSLYRVLRYQVGPTGEKQLWAITPPPLGPRLLESYPEIINSVRLQGGGGVLKYQDTFFSEDFLFADPSFLKVFSFRIVSGNANTALEDPKSIILTRKIASKYFEEEDPFGKTISVILGPHSYPFTVTGILEEIPRNSSLRFDVLLPWEFIKEYRGESQIISWQVDNTVTFIQLRAGISASSLEKQFPRVLEKHSHTHLNLVLQPLRDIHLNPGVRFVGLLLTSNPAYSYILSGIAFVVLLMACMNFMNLSIGRHSIRIEEVGLRKVLGAQRTHLIKQFLVEAILLSLFALIIGVVLAELFLPTFNALANSSFSLALYSNWTNLVFLFILILMVSLAAGAYPSLVISAFQPVDILKSKFKIGGKNLFSRILMVTQFSICVFLIVGTIIMARQLNFMREKDLGYDREQVVAVQVQADLFDIYRNEIAQYPNVLDVTSSSFRLARDWMQTSLTFKGKRVMVHNFAIDENYLDLLGIGLLKGRSFSKEFATDRTQAVIVNEAFVKELGMENPVGQKIPSFLGLQNPKIIGVVKNFHYLSLHHKVEPLVLCYRPSWFAYTLAKIRQNDISATLAYLEDEWQKIAPNAPFQYFFLEEDIDSQYQSEARWSRIVGYSSVLAIVIACLGLFGLTVLSVTHRTKEIGIRKVLGATVTNVVALLSKDFVKLVLLANLIAWPVAWLAMNRWLQNFAYRIDIGWWVFALAGGLALVIALLTVSTQAIRAALANPVESLRYE